MALKWQGMVDGLEGVRTILSTSTSRCVWVNGVELKATNGRGDAALYGKVYQGEVVTVWNGSDGSRLDFVVDVQYGDVCACTSQQMRLAFSGATKSFFSTKR